MAAKFLPVSSVHQQHVLITGSPGIGKTTLVRKVCAVLQDKYKVAIRGFYTQEVRGHAAGAGRGSRTGFDVVTFEEKCGPLARVKERVGTGPPPKKAPYVGKYWVDVESFESLALPALGTGKTREKGLMVIDEVGKMELFSKKFVERTMELFEQSRTDDHSQTKSEGGVVLLATIPIVRVHQRSHWLVEYLRERKDCWLIEVTEKNREELVEDIVKFISHRIYK